MIRCCAFWSLALCIFVATGRADDAPPPFAQVAPAFLQKHCIACHGSEKPKAGLSLLELREPGSVLTKRKTWDGVFAMLASGDMPPDDRPQPTVEEKTAFVASARAAFAEAARNAPPNPGRVTMRRLNRVEYRNTIRDLIGIDFDPAADFPADDVGHGFDNIGDVLTLSPVLMERYLAASEGIMQRAIMVNPPAPTKRHISAQYTEPAGPNVPKENHFRPITSEKSDSAILTGPIHTPYQWDAEGEYVFRARVYAKGEGDKPIFAAVMVTGGVATPASEEELGKISGRAVNSLKPLQVLATVEIKARDSKNAQQIEVKIPPMPGRQRTAIGLIKPAEGAPPVKLCVEYLALEGPLDPRPSSHRKLLAASADKPQPEQSREVLTRFASRAFRRPATPAEIDRLTKLVAARQAEGASWEAANQLAMQAVLCSPKFLFRVELDERPDSAEVRPLDEFQLASRLSYFLWSSMPDDELSSLAREGKLAANLESQVRRMLKDPKATSLVENFALQWLQLKRLETYDADKAKFPQFSDRLRRAMLKETTLTIDHIFRDDRSLIELLDSDYTFLDESLARHYGIRDTMGNRNGQKDPRPGGQPIPRENFVRVSLAGGERGGLLTQASILTVTSNPGRTSPVKRGKWVLEQLLGTPPPPAPPNVPLLAEDEKAQQSGSLRQRFEQHRANPSCANCHARMDPLGFALENYDAIGGYRTKDGEFPIDTAGELPDGRKISGAVDLKGVLKEKKDLFARCFAEKLLIYALGRGLEYYDGRALDQIAAAMAKGDYRLSALCVEITKSEPFRNRRGGSGF